MLPDKSGLAFCQELRQYPDEQIAQIPILMLTALAMPEDKLNGFHAGADDYLVKPFDPRELHARLQALLKRTRRGQESANGVIRRGMLALCLETRKAVYHGIVLSLKPQEFDLLLAMAQQPEKVFSREDLLKEVWGYSMVVPSRTIDIHVSRLRQKLKEASPRAENFIQTVHGIGYKLEIPPCPS
jgi:two-component system response regulator ResD